MNTLGQLGGGGAIVGIWSRLWTVFKYAIGAGLIVVSTAETYIIMNEAAYLPQIKAGEAAEKSAQASDPSKAIKRYRAGLPVTGADALVGAEVAGKNANARKDTAQADAMSEGEDEIRAKRAAGLPLTTTEQLTLLDLETKEQELRAKTAAADREQAEAKIKAAEASSAGAKAQADITTSNYINCMMSGANSYGDLVGREMAASLNLGQGRLPCPDGRRRN